jgi:hypothetical protein
VEGIFFRLLETASAKLSETECVVSPGTMAAALVDLVASPEFWTPLWTTENKKELTEAITPYVSAWYEGDSLVSAARNQSLDLEVRCVDK